MSTLLRVCHCLYSCVLSFSPKSIFKSISKSKMTLFKCLNVPQLLCFESLPLRIYLHTSVEKFVHRFETYSHSSSLGWKMLSMNFSEKRPIACNPPSSNMIYGYKTGIPCSILASRCTGKAHSCTIFLRFEFRISSACICIQILQKDLTCLNLSNYLTKMFAIAQALSHQLRMCSSFC